MGVISMLVQKLCVFVYMLWPLLQSTHQIMVEPNRPIRESDQAPVDSRHRTTELAPPRNPPARRRTTEHEPIR